MSSINSSSCIIFDLDGTLIDTAPGLANSMNVLLQRRGRGNLSLEALRPHISHGAKAIITHAMSVTGEAASEAQIEQMFDEFLTHYRRHMAEASLPYPGLTDCLDQLKAQGHILGICTNRFEASAHELLSALGLQDYFDSVTGQDSYGVGKPDPRPVLETLKCLGGQVGNAVFIGDSEIDVAAAKAAGLPVIVTSFGYGEIPVQQMNADAVIGHFDELSHCVNSLLSNGTK